LLVVLVVKQQGSLVERAMLWEKKRKEKLEIERSIKEQSEVSGGGRERGREGRKEGNG